ncbi:hypothetical protein AB0E62_14795 [Streptomyces sp. NPDC038707]|uniref:hypothetical protein n=1 Tax=Streptomyces sp. NPDC038707 TaxID=3154329 RepID=UPI0033E55328
MPGRLALPPPPPGPPTGSGEVTGGPFAGTPVTAGDTRTRAGTFTEGRTTLTGGGMAATGGDIAAVTELRVRAAEFTTATEGGAAVISERATVTGERVVNVAELPFQTA